MNNPKPRAFPIPPFSCLGCGELQRSIATVEPLEEIEGHIAVCSSCYQIMIFNVEATVRLPTEEELSELSKDEAFTMLMYDLTGEN